MRGGSMRKVLYIGLVILLVGSAALGGWWYGSQNSTKQQPSPSKTTTETETNDSTGEEKPKTEFTSPKGVKIIVTEPLKNSLVKSPLTVKGSVPGNWSFEASFPVKLLDANRKIVAQSPASLSGDWMTDAMVPFSASIPFTAPATSTGYLVLEKDNPSGAANNDDRVEISVRYFK
jgi:hypothetical protein